jgi:serine/threonine protein kinase
MATSEPDLLGLEDVSDYVIFIDEYADLGSLGQGTFGKVWKGQSRITGWTVAVKELLTDRLDGQDLEFYRREVRILISCNDPFLLDFLGFTMTPPYSIVTSFMPCGSLWDGIHNRALELNAAQKTNIAMGIAHGMMYLHSHKIVHRDLKSPNILLDERLLPKIADFGLGRFVTDCDSFQQMTNNIGTPIWMAPELLEGTVYGPPVDVYAYGMILCEMYTETIPFSGLDRIKIFKLVVDAGKRPPLPDPDSPIARLIAACWAQDPNDRPTFEHIYTMFADHTVQFPGSAVEATSILVHEVTRAEETVGSAVVQLAKEINEMLDIRKVVRSHAEKQMMVGDIIRRGDVSALNLLLMAYADVNINEADASGVPPLHLAVQVGELLIVEYILKIQTADANIRDEEGNTPLIAAVKWGHPRIAGLLAQSESVDVNIQNKYGWTALHVAGMLDRTWHAPMLYALATAKELRVDLQDWEGKTPFANDPAAIQQFRANQDQFSGKKF